jgi:hypothetical protein
VEWKDELPFRDSRMSGLLAIDGTRVGSIGIEADCFNRIVTHTTMRVGETTTRSLLFSKLQLTGMDSIY